MIMVWADDRYVDTPFWISFRDRDWKPVKKIQENAEMIPATRKIFNHSRYYLAIDIPCNLYEDELIDNIKEQIINYLEIISKDL